MNGMVSVSSITRERTYEYIFVKKRSVSLSPEESLQRFENITRKHGEMIATRPRLAVMSMLFADLERNFGVLEADSQKESGGSSTVDKDWKADIFTFFRCSTGKVVVHPFDR